MKAPVSNVYDSIAQKTGYSVHRLRITKGSDGSVLPNGPETIESMGLRPKSVLYIKDLGMKLPIHCFVLFSIGSVQLLIFLFCLRPATRLAIRLRD